MGEPSLKTLLENLPAFWREVDESWQAGEGEADGLRQTGKPYTGGPADPGGSHRSPDRPQRGAGLPVPPGYAAFADLVDLAPAAAFIRDRDGRYLWANNAYAHLYGTMPQQLVGRYIEDFDAPAEADRFRALDQQVLARGTPVRHTLRYLRQDGTTGRAVGHRFPVREQSRTCIAGIYVDITDHLRATAQRQEAEENLSALRDHSGLPCALLSANGRVIEASVAAAELFHVGLTDLVGRRAHTLLAPEPGPGLDRLHSRWNSLIARRTRRVETTAVLVDTQGLQRRAELHLTTIGHSAGRARHVWAVITHQSLAHEAHPPLTAAQIRILSLLAQGSSNGDIAASLKLSRQTLDYHLSRLRHLLGAPSRPALVARAYVLGILAPHAWPPRSATAVHPLSTA
ncbi:PAS domain-containing protein [Streptomyces sp. NPDC048404]|uniref:PAS domain-containing protein n=1 Tax=unclassified Streptomyces TaxID=2593676 RepID=UPI00341F0D2A